MFGSRMESPPRLPRPDPGRTPPQPPAAPSPTSILWPSHPASPQTPSAGATDPPCIKEEATPTRIWALAVVQPGKEEQPSPATVECTVSARRCPPAAAEGKDG